MRTKLLLLVLPLFLVSCGTPEVTLKGPDPLVGAKCAELSGLSGHVEQLPFAGITFVFSEDNTRVAECEGKTPDEVTLLHILE